MARYRRHPMKFKPSTTHDVVVIVPTVANPDVLLPTFQRLAQDAVRAAARVGIVLAINSPDPTQAEEVATACDEVARQLGIDLILDFHAAPIGFGAANNRGTVAAFRRWGVPELAIYHNDDAHVPEGFADRMLAAARTEVIHGYSEPYDLLRGVRPDRPAALYGRIGIVGPTSNLVAGIQQVTEIASADGKSVTRWRGDVEHFDRVVSSRYPGQRVTADFISGFCVGLTRDALSDLWLEWDGGKRAGPWDEERYPIAGYEDNDLCVRAELAGWRCVVVADLFVGHVGHQTFDRLFPEALRGMRNRAAYYERWRDYTRPEGGHRLVAIFRVALAVCHDLHILRLALLRTAQLVDGIAIELTANPLEMRNDKNWADERRMLQPEDDAMLRTCSGLDAGLVAEAFRSWACALVATAKDGRLGTTVDEVRPRILVESWTGEFNERDERNASIALAETLEPTWILSVDHDEVIENRITREHLDRCMTHPDPLVRSWDQSWINHWDSERLMRIDRPWGDGGSWIGAMHGFRLWRSLGRRIIAGTENGLHCGNSPDHDVVAKRVSGIRFRHFGYIRSVDRVRKHKRYRVQDPNADPMLTGNAGRDAYSHILAEEGMRLSPFTPMTGVGLTMLVHAGESVADVSRHLDTLSGFADRVVLVWTDPWAPEDMDRVLEPAPEEDAAHVREREEVIQRWRDLCAQAPEGATLPPRPPTLRAARRVCPPSVRGAVVTETGPSAELLDAAEAFGAEFVHQLLDDHIAAARNAGLEALSIPTRSSGVGWSLFLDPDEHFAEPYAAVVALRRMAEASDTYAWLFRFVNTHRDSSPTPSESYRMARLVREMRLSGRVHETYDAALSGIAAMGIHPTTRVAPFTMTNIGVDGDDEVIDRKVRRYRDLLLLELRDHPHNSTAWVSLGLALLNEGNEEQAEECLGNAVACAQPGQYLAFRELAMLHLRRARPLFHLALGEAGASPWARENQSFGEALAVFVPPMLILGSNRHGLPEHPERVELPAFTPPEDSGWDLLG